MSQKTQNNCLHFLGVRQEKGTSFVELAISLPLLTFLFLSIAQANFYVASQLDAKVIQTNLATVPLGSGGRIENGAYVADIELEQKESSKIRDRIVEQLVDLGYESSDYHVSVTSTLLPIATETEAPAGGAITFLGPEDAAAVRPAVNEGNCSSCDDQNWTDSPDHLVPGEITRIGVDTTFVRMNSDDVPRFESFALSKRGQVADETVYLYEISIKPQGIASAIPFLNGAVSVKGALLPSKGAGRNAVSGDLAARASGGTGGRSGSASSEEYSASSAKEVTFVNVEGEGGGEDQPRSESDTVAMNMDSLYKSGKPLTVDLRGATSGNKQFICDSSAPTTSIENAFGIPEEDKPDTWYGDGSTLPPPARSAFIVVDSPKGKFNPCMGIDFSDLALNKAESFLTTHEIKEEPLKEDFTAPVPDAPDPGGNDGGDNDGDDGRIGPEGPVNEEGNTPNSDNGSSSCPLGNSHNSSMSLWQEPSVSYQNTNCFAR